MRKIVLLLKLLNLIKLHSISKYNDKELSGLLTIYKSTEYGLSSSPKYKAFSSGRGTPLIRNKSFKYIVERLQ